MSRTEYAYLRIQIKPITLKFQVKNCQPEKEHLSFLFSTFNELSLTITNLVSEINISQSASKLGLVLSMPLIQNANHVIQSKVKSK